MIKKKNKKKKEERKTKKRSKIIFLQCFFLINIFLKKINLKAFSYVERGGGGIKKRKKKIEIEIKHVTTSKFHKNILN